MTNTNNGPCIVCFSPTDTAVAVRGDATWHTAALMAIGIPIEQAKVIVMQEVQGTASIVAGRWDTTVRVCGRCVRRRNPHWPDPALTLPGHAIPGLVQP